MISPFDNIRHLFPPARSPRLAYPIRRASLGPLRAPGALQARFVFVSKVDHTSAVESRWADEVHQSSTGLRTGPALEDERVGTASSHRLPTCGGLIAGAIPTGDGPLVYGRVARQGMEMVSQVYGSAGRSSSSMTSSSCKSGIHSFLFAPLKTTATAVECCGKEPRWPWPGHCWLTFLLSIGYRGG